MPAKDIQRKKIDDFGIQLDGAKKQHYLAITDISNMTLRELMTNVQKKNVWPEPDWKSIHDGNKEADPVAMYYVRMVRDGFKPRPAIKSASSIERARELCIEYIQIAQALEAVGFEVITSGDYTYMVSAINNAQTTVTESLLTNNLNKLSELTPTKVRDACELQDFPNNTVGRLKRAFINVTRAEVTNADGSVGVKKVYTICRNARKGVVTICKSTFDTREDAINYARNVILKQKDTRKAVDMNKLVYLMRPELAKINRKGPDIRKNVNVIEPDILNTFGIAGGEFGVWHSQDDRQALLNYVYDSLYDLAHILGIPNRCIGLEYMNEKLSLSFGARGSGFQEKAKYMVDASGNEIIHIQKLKGAGWVSRAYASALDAFMGAKCNGKKESLYWYIRNNRAVGGSPDLVAALQSFHSALIKTRYIKILRTSRAMTNRAFELCFESYIEDKLAANGIKNDFLVTSTKAQAPRHPNGMLFTDYYPQGDERKLLNQKIEDVLNVALKEMRQGYIATAVEETPDGVRIVALDSKPLSVFDGKVQNYIPGDNSITADATSLIKIGDVYYRDINDENTSADEGTLYADTDNYTEYTDNIVSADEFEGVGSPNIGESSLNLMSRLDRMAGSLGHTPTDEEMRKMCNRLVSKVIGKGGLKVAMADTRAFIKHYDEPYYLTSNGKYLVLNSSTRVSTLLESVIAGLVDNSLGKKDEQDMLSKAVRNASVYCMCKQCGLKGLASKYCNNDVFTAMEGNNVLIGRLLDGVRDVYVDIAG